MLQSSIRHKVGVRDGIVMDRKELDEIADQVRKSLTVLDDLDPRTANAVRESYALAVRWCFIACAVFFAGALTSATAVSDKRIGDYEDKEEEAGVPTRDRQDHDHD